MHVVKLVQHFAAGDSRRAAVNEVRLSFREVHGALFAANIPIQLERLMRVLPLRQ